MPLEVGNYIADFDTTTPDGSVDPVYLLDDGQRLIKQFVKQSFPNIASEVSATAGDLNRLIYMRSIDRLMENVSPAYSVNFNGVNQSAIASGSTSLIQFTTESFDTRSIYDNTTNYRATITIAGRYLAIFTVQPTTDTSGSVIVPIIYVNGAEVARGGVAQTGSGNVPISPCIKILNLAVGDVVEYYVLNASSGSKIINGDSNVTYADLARLW